MTMPKIRWVEWGDNTYWDAFIGPFPAANTLCGNVNGPWSVYRPDDTIKIGTAATEAEAKALAERWISEEWSKLMVEALSQDNEK